MNNKKKVENPHYLFYRDVYLKQALKKDPLNFEDLKTYFMDIDFDLELQEFKDTLIKKINSYFQAYKNYFEKYYSHRMPAFLLSNDEIKDKKKEMYKKTFELWQKIHKLPHYYYHNW